MSDIKGDMTALEKIAPYANESIKIEDIAHDSYITTDNMLQNKMGVIPFVGNPNIGSITKFQQGDILISNIRPYLKKIWLSSFDGGCSKDVLVIRSIDTALVIPKYVYYMLRRDDFFAYVMEGKNGIKMPRGDKEKILKYKLITPPVEEQRKIVAEIEILEQEVAKALEIIDNAPALKAAVLKKHI